MKIKILIILALLGLATNISTKAVAETSDDQHIKKSIAQYICAPWDGPGYTIWIPGELVGGKSESWVNLTVWEHPDNSQKSINFPDKTQRVGYAMYWPSLKSHDQIDWAKETHYDLAGKLYFTRVNSRESILGTLNLNSEKGIHLEGKFEVLWDTKQKVFFCG